MAVGNEPKHSPIVDAIAAAETRTTGEIRVHLTRRLFEKDPLRRAQQLFEAFGMHQTQDRNAVLLYVNLRRRKFAILGDLGVHAQVGPQYWETVLQRLRLDLHSTHHENAIALAVLEIGKTLEKYFPAELNGEKMNQLPNAVSED